MIYWSYVLDVKTLYMNIINIYTLLGGGGGVQAYHFGKKDFELGVGGEGQDTSRHF